MPNYFIRKQYESSDRNQLDKEIREYAAEKLTHIYVNGEYIDMLRLELEKKVAELNAKYARVSKKLDVSIRTSQKDTIYISFSECLQYVAYAIEDQYNPF